jgi:hypothetical protein
MTDTNPRDLIQDLADALETLQKEAVTTSNNQVIVVGGVSHPIPIGNDLLARDALYGHLLSRARAYLAQPEPEEPTNEEILALSHEHEVSYTMCDGHVIYPKQEGCDMRDDVLSFTRAVLARWGK